MFSTIPVFSIVSQPFKRSQLGLFQGKTKQYGNNVPFSKHKTRRTWLPNVQRKRLFSDILAEDVRVKLTTRALRTIKKHGGLDKYVEKSRADILGWEGMRIRLMLREHKEKEIVKSEAKAEELVTVDAAELSKRGGITEEAREARHKAPSKFVCIGRHKPSIQDGERQRDAVMKALNLDSWPTAQQTIAFLKEKDLIKVPRPRS